ncbi:MAG: hypothetical protein IJ731_09415 [Eubacterium sp.]|nr:hypothetical protein [Eubacterium sp.]
MRYIVMADGKGSRWENYSGVSKHLVEINGETLLARITNLLRKYDKNAEVIITAHKKEYETEGAVLYAPLHNEFEIDRFTRELIDDNICFLYGDTYYSEEAIKTIVETEADDLLFFGADKSIVAVKIKDGDLFRKHFERVRKLFVEGKIKQCIGWQVYLSFQNLDLEKKQIADKFILFNDSTCNFNSPDDIQRFFKTEESV